MYVRCYCTVVKRVSCTSRHYPKGIPKSNVRLVVSRMSTVRFAECTFGGPLQYVRTKNRSARPPLEGQCLTSIFIRVQSVVRLTLRVLGLAKTSLSKTLLIALMEKVVFNKKVCFYQGITLSPPYRYFILEI